MEIKLHICPHCTGDYVNRSPNSGRLFCCQLANPLIVLALHMSNCSGRGLGEKIDTTVTCLGYVARSRETVSTSKDSKIPQTSSSKAHKLSSHILFLQSVQRPKSESNIYFDYGQSQACVLRSIFMLRLAT